MLALIRRREDASAAARTLWRDKIGGQALDPSLQAEMEDLKKEARQPAVDRLNAAYAEVKAAKEALLAVDPEYKEPTVAERLQAHMEEIGKPLTKEQIHKWAKGEGITIPGLDNTLKKWAEAGEGQKWSLKDGKYSLVEPNGKYRTLSQRLIRRERTTQMNPRSSAMRETIWNADAAMPWPLR